MSIPVTLRSVLKCVTEQIDQLLLPPPPVTPIEISPISKIGQERRQAFIESRFIPGGARMDQSVREPVYNQQSPVVTPNYPDMASTGFSLEAYSPEFDNPLLQGDLTDNKVSKNPMLASLLDQGSNSNKNAESHNAPMLSALLGDQAQQQPNPMAQPMKQRQKRKRKQSDALSPGASKSPKAALTDSDVHPRLSSSTIESDTSPVHSAVTTPTSAGPSQENTLISESHVSLLASSLDNIIKQEAKGTSTVQQSDLASILGDLEKDIPVKKPVIKRENSSELMKLGIASTLEDLLSNDGSNIGKETATNLQSQASAANSLATKQPVVEATSKSIPDEKMFGEPTEFEFESKSVVDNLIKSLDNSGEDPGEDIDLNNISNSSVSSTENGSISPEKLTNNFVFKIDKDKDKKKRDNHKDDKDRDKPPITVTLRTKDVASFVTETRGEFTKLDNYIKDKSENKNSKVSKDLKLNIKNTLPTDDPYDLPSDDEKFPTWPTRLPTLSNKEKKKRKHLDGESKRKKEDGRKESSKKRRKTHEAVENIDMEDKHVKPSTTIKITTVGGKVQVQNLHRGIPVSPGSGGHINKTVSSKSNSTSAESLKSQTKPNSVLKLPVVERGGSPHSKSSKSGSSRIGRSKSSSGALGSSKIEKVDSKLVQKMPQIKLKPVAVNSSNVTVNVASNKSPSSGTSPVTAPANPMPQSAPAVLSSKAKQPIRSRKGSLSAVIDKLKQNHTPPLPVPVPEKKEKINKIENVEKRDKVNKIDVSDKKEKLSKLDLQTSKREHMKEKYMSKIDPTVSKRDQMEMIRRQLINEGTKPSTPTKELGVIPKAPPLGPTLSFKKLDPSKLENKVEARRLETSKASVPSSVTKTNNTTASNKSNVTANISKPNVTAAGNKSNTNLPVSKSNVTSLNNKSSSGNLNSNFNNSSNKASKSTLPGASPKSAYGASPGRTPPHNSFGNRGPPPTAKSGGPPSQRNPHNSVDTNRHESVRNVPQPYGANKDSRDYGAAKDTRDFNSGIIGSKNHGSVKMNLPNKESNARSEMSNKLNQDIKTQEREFIGKESQSCGKSKESDKDSAGKSEHPPRHFTDIVVKLGDKPESETRQRESLEDHFEDISDDGIASPDEMPEPLPSTSETKSIPLTQDQSLAQKHAETAADSLLVNQVTDVTSEHCDHNHDSQLENADGAQINSVIEDSVLSSSENKENNSEDAIFKAPTPKPVRNNCEQDRTCKNDTRSRAVASPRSDISSPDDRLVIDSPGTPRSVRSSPINRRSERSPLNPSPVQETLDSAESSGKHQETMSPRKSPININMSSSMLIGSPVSKSPGSDKSNFEIDDDLMNEALMYHD